MHLDEENDAQHQVNGVEVVQHLHADANHRRVLGNLNAAQLAELLPFFHMQVFNAERPEHAAFKNAEWGSGAREDGAHDRYRVVYNIYTVDPVPEHVCANNCRVSCQLRYVDCINVGQLF